MNSVLDISNQRQLFVDSVLIDKTTVEVRLELAKPELQVGVLETTDPRERNTCSCYSLFRDGAYMRLYYRGSHFIEDENRHAGHGVLCYAHSRDGVHWKRPQGELFAFNGSRKTTSCGMAQAATISCRSSIKLPM